MTGKDYTRLTAAQQRELSAFADTLVAKQFGKRVAKLRKSLGLSQTEVSRRVRLSQSAIAMIEGGARMPSLATLVRLRRALGYPTWDLLLSTKELR